MKPSIVSKYEENRSSLVEKIRTNSIEVTYEKPGNNVCYFCNNKIKDTMVKLTEKDDDKCKTFYFLDINCYDGTKPFKDN